MHPLYLSDFIANVKEQLRRDSSLINEQLDALAKTEDSLGQTYSALDLRWHSVHIGKHFHTLQHELLQLQKSLEKLEQNAK